MKEAISALRLSGALRLSKNPWRVREGRSSLELLIMPGGVYGGRGTIFAEENLIFQSKNRFLAVFAPGNLKDFLQKLVGAAVARELALPSTSLSKTFLTSCALRLSGALASSSASLPKGRLTN